jgi:hypothetical protein
MTIVLKARCRIFAPTYRLIRAQFDVEQHKQPFAEYVVVNLLRERGVLEDGRFYQIIIDPLPR